MELQKQETSQTSSLTGMEAPKKRGRPKAESEARKLQEEAAPAEESAAIVPGIGNSWGKTRRSALMSKSELDRKLKNLMQEESRMVTGKFIYHELPGGYVDIFQRKYKDLPVFEQRLYDGYTYTIPLWVARWLNGIDKASGAYQGVINSGAFPIYKHEQTTDWNGQIRNLEPIGRWTRRFSFQSMDFLV